MKKMFLFLLILNCSVAAFAQQATQAQEMKKLDFLVGEWQGEGWTEFVPGQRRTASITEKAQSKLNGTVLLLEGLGKTKVPGKQEEIVVHNALGVLSYDANAKLYRLNSFLADGRSTDAEASFVDGAFQWRMQVPQMSIRYTIKLTEKGEWFEQGEMSQDGKTWRQFHEMTLRRVK
ncbi:MAG: hypothetical protein SF097_15380 [Acidobacteriota bacterium]|nr:hypothetical protein [Acidobacteriota bacterium]